MRDSLSLSLPLNSSRLSLISGKGAQNENTHKNTLSEEGDGLRVFKFA